ncbi:DNA/RNA nuclease SfsA [Phaeobacter italicus]|uniref:DNA/RNA nuclease SfsA n=1 Tax=Phaeobacter italicus TaxID=481446 RepID=UPI00232C18F1|nr:DNA/RNA nuclease SfsA [Phaeobacter italicus]
MRFPTPLLRARLIRRYKRFLADCELPDGREVTAHCANPGSMMGLAEPGSIVWLEPNDDPKKKLKYGWRLVEVCGGTLVGVDTSVPNRALKTALEARQIAPLAAYETVRAEVKYAEKSRIDFLLSQPDLPDCYVEVKSVTLSRTAGLAEFPDSVTARGAKHLGNLAQMCRAGHRAVLLYLVQRGDCDRFAIARDIDPAYGAAWDEAAAAGVERLVISTSITSEAVEIAQPIVAE